MLGFEDPDAAPAAQWKHELAKLLSALPSPAIGSNLIPEAPVDPDQLSQLMCGDKATDGEQ